MILCWVVVPLFPFRTFCKSTYSSCLYPFELFFFFWMRVNMKRRALIDHPPSSQSRRAATKVCPRTPRTRRTTARTRKRDTCPTKTCATTRTRSREPWASAGGRGPPSKPNSWRPWRQHSLLRPNPPDTSGNSCPERPASTWGSSR